MRNDSNLCLTSELQDVFIRAPSCISIVNFPDGANALVKHSKPKIKIKSVPICQNTFPLPLVKQRYGPF